MKKYLGLLVVLFVVLFGGVAMAAVLSGTSASETITGTNNADTLDATQGGADSIVAKDGRDTVYASDGESNDTVTCGKGDDYAKVDVGDTVYSNCETVERVPIASPRSPPPPRPVVGLYAGYHNTSGLDNFYTWLGYTGPQYAHEFVDHRYGWPPISSCVWQGWKDWVAQDDANRRLTISLPLLPTGYEDRFEDLARGTYDSYFKACASSVNGTAAHDMIVRLGWEMNGNTFPWRVASGREAAYQAAFRHVAQVMKAANPDLQIEWEPNVTLDYNGHPMAEFYPGDDVVDYIGLSVYDYCIMGCTSNTVEGRWANLMEPQPVGGANNGLRYHAEFAAAHGKPMTFTEWALWPAKRSPGGGRDSPTFVHRLADWMAAHNVAYHVYNQGHSDHNLDQYPNSKAAYHDRFTG